MKAVTLKEAREFCKRQIAEWRDGWVDRIGPNKGKITDANAIRAIETLQFILKTLPKPTKGRRPRGAEDAQA